MNENAFQYLLRPRALSAVPTPCVTSVERVFPPSTSCSHQSILSPGSFWKLSETHCFCIYLSTKSKHRSLICTTTFEHFLTLMLNCQNAKVLVIFFILLYFKRRSWILLIIYWYILHNRPSNFLVMWIFHVYMCAAFLAYTDLQNSMSDHFLILIDIQNKLTEVVFDCFMKSVQH